MMNMREASDTGPLSARKAAGTAILRIATVLVVALCLIPGADSRGTVPAPELPGADRLPLAMSSGLVERPSTVRPAEALERAHPGSDLLARVPSDEIIQALVDSTDSANMMATIQRLQDFVSRYVVVDSCWAAGYWLEEQFRFLGYSDVRLDTFRTWTFQDPVDALNVLAYKEGTTSPSEYVVLGGHYDSVTTDNFWDPDAPAPGAEDNGTGVAAVLEAARILADVPTERSIIFACWSAEEVGLWGSRDFVAKAVEQDLDIVLYLNVDCIGMPASEAPHATVYSDSTALAVGAFMSDVAAGFTDHIFDTTVQPLGASDQNSFWEAGYNVVDTDPNGWNQYIHTPVDVIDHVDPDILWSIAAVNIVTTAAVAGVVGDDPNLPPETTLLENCEATHDLLTCCPVFEWEAVDFDGVVVSYEYAVTGVASYEYAVSGRDWDGRREWVPLPADQTSVMLRSLEEGNHVFEVRAVDDDGAPDPTPAFHAFAAQLLHPTISVDANFLPGPIEFEGHWSSVDDVRVAVFDGELLEFDVSSDSGWYCGVADTVAVALNDTTAWSGPAPSPFAFSFRPGPADTAVFFRTRDENGIATVGKMALAVVPAPMDRPLLHVDDWHDSSVGEEFHDAFYETLLAAHDWDEWDPLEHIEGGWPALPPMEELGRYRTVLWTLDKDGGFLRAAQAGSTYHDIEGYVRAGGNCILEGQSALTSFGGGTPYSHRTRFGPGSFVYDHVGVDSLKNAGANANPAYPDAYGYAFLGGTAVLPGSFVDVPVDTLGKWSDTYGALGGIPYCEIVRPRDATSRLYPFDSYLNATLDELPCGTAHYSVVGAGTFAYFGFPFYYLKTAPAVEMTDALLASLSAWQEPAELLFCEASAAPESVSLWWYLVPPDDPIGCNLQRKAGTIDSPDAYEQINEQLIRVGASGRYAYTDHSVAPATTYSYRLEVVERWGGTTFHGPWQVDVPPGTSSDHFSSAYPNPFRESVGFRFGVAADARWVSITVHDLAGRVVKTLEYGMRGTGRHDVEWDGTNVGGQRVASGVYFVRAKIGDASFVRKVVLLE